MTSARINIVRNELEDKVPVLADAIFNGLAKKLIPFPDDNHHFPKTGYQLNDPVWKTISLTQLQAAIIELPLMQRLRRIRQLGLAYLVFPSANHTRFEHSIGAAHAALQMFDHLSRQAGLTDRDKIHARLREAVQVAALLHDCGHTVFSHVGERVLQTRFKDEFDIAQQILNSSYASANNPTADDDHEKIALKAKRPPAAELISALLVLSPAFEKYLEEYTKRSGSIATNISNLLDDSCALILGKDLSNPVDEQKNSYNFITTLLSGDIDTDKIDYVARDAYFAGLPVSADIQRLLLQLTTADVTKSTSIENSCVKFNAGDPTKYCFLGITPSGTSTLEMFVLTRSYLFDRLYTHHKVRSSERTLERLLFQRLGFNDAVYKWDLAKTLEYLFSSGGDDYILNDISFFNPVPPEIEKEHTAEQLNNFFSGFANRVNKIQSRKLPRRVVAISSRFQDGYKSNKSYRKSSNLIIPWNTLDNELATDIGQREFEHELCKLCLTEPGTDIYIDYPVPNPIKENPCIWVSDPTESDTIYRVNRYFNAEQLSNSYQDVKQLIWIFADKPKEELPKVAAAIEFLLFKKYRVSLSSDAFRRAKIAKESVRNALTEFRESFASKGSTEDICYIDYILNEYDKRAIDVRKDDFLKTLSPFIEGGDAEEASARLCNAMQQLNLSIHHGDQYNAALQVLKHLCAYAKANWSSPKFREEVPSHNEDRFQKSLKEYLETNSEVAQVFDIHEAAKTAGGIPDILMISKYSSVRIYVELKSSNESVHSLYEKNAKQPAEYASSQNERISILFCQFGQKDSITPAQTLQIREVGESPTAKHAILCLGVRAFCESPSHNGSGSRAVN